MRFRKVLLVVCSLSLGAVGFAQDAPPPVAQPQVAPQAADAAQTATYSLKRVVTKGGKIKYKLTADVDGGGTQVNVRSTVTEEVQDIKDNGDYVIKSSQTETVATVNGQEFPPEPDAGNVITYNALGDVLDIKALASVVGSSEWRLANLGLLRAPDQPVKVGDAWTYKIAGKSQAGVDAIADYKLLATEKIGDRLTLKISAKIKETTGSAPASSDGTVWVDAKDFSMVKTETTWTNAPVPGAPMPINGKIAISLLE